MGSAIFFEHSYWFFILCFLAGTGYAFLLYYKYKAPWSYRVTWQLFTFRAVLISLLAGLLVGPFLKIIQNQFEKPKVVIVIDNSLSLKMVEDSISLYNYMADLKQLASRLSNSGYEIRLRTFDEENTSLNTPVSFEHQVTNLNALLRSVQNDFEGTNLGAVVLLSDGIYNQGISPTFTEFTFPVYPVGIGDTISKQDLVIKNVMYNRLSYLGNQFPVVAEVYNEGYTGKPIKISIRRNNQEIASEIFTFSRNNQLKKVEFLLDAEEIGLQRYTVKLEGMPDEFTYVNNIRNVFIDIIDGKEQILIIAASPHPDIKAIVSAIETNDNYNVELFIPGIYKFPETIKDIDLVIYHQIPDSKRLTDTYVKRIKEQKIPEFYIVGSQTNISALNKAIAPVRINSPRNQGDLVTAIYYPSFNFFGLSSELVEFLSKFPPVRVPFGQINIDIESSVLLLQRVGSVETGRPLLLFRNTDDKKTGILFGEGIWQWKLFDYAKNKNNTLSDELILKSIQYLTTRDDKRKFRIFPRINEFLENEPVILDAEAYNSLYEVIYDVKIDISITSDTNRSVDYTFVTSKNNSSFSIRDLGPGIYSFQARAVINGQPHQVSGEFAVKALDIEAINLTADHHLLRELAIKSGGQFYFSGQLDELGSALILNKSPDVIHSSEQFFPLINLTWVFFILLALITGEWFIRKYHGGY